MTTDFQSLAYLKLCVQRGLLGNVSANIACVYAHLENCQIIISTCFFEDPTNDDREGIEIMATEVIADFPYGYTIETRYAVLSESRVEYSEPLMFLRMEAYKWIAEMKNRALPNDGTGAPV